MKAHLVSGKGKELNGVLANETKIQVAGHLAESWHLMLSSSFILSCSAPLLRVHRDGPTSHLGANSRADSYVSIHQCFQHCDKQLFQINHCCVFQVLI